MQSRQPLRRRLLLIVRRHGQVTMILGLASGHVSLASAHDAWTAAYDRERSKIATGPSPAR